MGAAKTECHEWLTPKQIVERYPISIFTIYDWQARPKKYRTPDGMIKKFGRKLYIRVDLLNRWFMTRG